MPAYKTNFDFLLRSKHVMMNDLQFDAKHIWHPYTSLPAAYPLYQVIATNHTRITLDDGRELIDGMSSWWSAIHGYNHPELQRAMRTQIDRFSHIMFGGLTHQPAIDLSRKLINITPDGLNQVFYTDSGSIAVEVAIKIALQYQFANDKPAKTKIVTLRGSYHGDTFAAMSISDPETGMHDLFGDVLMNNLFAPKPSCVFGQPWRSEHDEQIVKIERLIEANHDQIAAFILEPIVQGAGGMYFYHSQYLKSIRKLCDTFGIVLIADEIATGFGRTGRLFACEYAHISPDILCLGKSITGGMMSFAATMTTEKISQTISQNHPNVLMHGPTFMGNPLACATALASIDILERSDWQKSVEQIAQQLKINLSPCADLDNVKEVRVLGAIGVVELFAPVDIKIIQPMLVDAGVWVRPFGRLVYVMPAFSISINDLRFLCAAIFRVLKHLSTR